jgi:hypothetical protein
MEISHKKKASLGSLISRDRLEAAIHCLLQAAYGVCHVNNSGN